MRKQFLQNVIKYLFLGIYAILILYPIFFILLSSFKDNQDIFTNPWGLPKVFNWLVYFEVWVKFDVQTYLFNSLYYASMGCLISMLVCTMAAYAISRLKWKLSKPVLGFFLLGLMVPIHAALVPLYVSVSKIGLKNPRITMVGIFVAFSIPTTIYILTGFLESIPRAMEESAVIDGCNIVRVFASIVVPLLKPALATITIFNFLSMWNDLLFGLVFINNEKQKTLQLGIMKFQGQFATRYSYLLAAIVITIIPSIAAYIILQDRIIKGMTAGAVKG